MQPQVVLQQMLLMGRRFRTKLDLLVPFVVTKVEKSQHKMIENNCGKNRMLAQGDDVIARNYGKGEKWQPGIISDVLGDRHYNVNVDGREVKCHVDQMINVKKHVEERDVPQIDLTMNNENATIVQENVSQNVNSNGEISNDSDSSSVEIISSTRNRHPPAYKRFCSSISTLVVHAY